MSPEILGLVSLATLFVAICVGFPISFTLLFLGVVFGYIGFGDTVFFLLVVQTFGVMRETLLAAVPLFLFMGFILEQAGLMDRLFSGFRMMLANVKGSLYIAVLVTATLFAAATGIVIPGVMLAALYMFYAVARSYMNPALGPALPDEEKADSVGEIIKELLIGIVPLAVLIMSVLGSILAGLATPTDAAAMGALGAFLLSVVYRRLTWERLKKAIFQTMLVSSMILFLVATSNFYGAVFARLGTATMIAETLVALELAPMVLLILVLGLIFLLGWPLEWVPIVLVVIPILLPAVESVGIDLLWFCTLVAVCLQTAWLSPPVALSAYYIKGVVPDWSLRDIYAGMMQFMVIQVIGLLLILFFPQISLWLPTLLFRN
jgi:TRAP-type mannitol/chloroaromatic compound transport system permease large subunit